MKRAESSYAAWEDRPSALERVGKGALLLILCGLVIVPLWMVVVTSLSTEADIAAAGGLVMFPKELSLNAYRFVFQGGTVPRALGVSIFITFVGVAASTVVTAMAAYGLSRVGTLWHRPLLFIIMFTFLFGPSMIPLYLTVQTLGLIDQFAALILPSMVAAFNLIILRAFFMGLPAELTDAARIDGAGEFRIFTSIVLPLSKAPIAVVALFYGVGYWNNFFNALLYINSPEKWPLQLLLRQIVLQGRAVDSGEVGSANYTPVVAPEIAVQMAVVVIAMVPVLLVYPFVQRHFVKGVVIGAVKG